MTQARAMSGGETVPEMVRAVLRLVWSIGVVLAVMRHASAPVAAQPERSPEPLVIDSAREAVAHALIHNLMSPYCPGLLLADCRSEGARELRREIEQRIVRGEAADAIEADLVERFGPAIRTMPDFRGSGLVAWVAPALLGGGGFMTVVFIVRGLTRRRTSDTGASPPSADAELDRRVGEELANLD